MDNPINVNAQRFDFPSFLVRVRRIARKMWRGFREWSDDAAYERYLRSRSVRLGAPCALTAEEFYVDLLDRRYSRPNRCC